MSDTPRTDAVKLPSELLLLLSDPLMGPAIKSAMETLQSHARELERELAAHPDCVSHETYENEFQRANENARKLIALGRELAEVKCDRDEGWKRFKEMRAIAAEAKYPGMKGEVHTKGDDEQYAVARDRTACWRCGGAGGIFCAECPACHGSGKQPPPRAYRNGCFMQTCADAGACCFPSNCAGEELTVHQQEKS